MSNLLVTHNGSSTESLRDETLYQLENWNIQYLDLRTHGPASIRSQIQQKEIYFLLVIKDISESTINDLSLLRKTFPLLSIIYYNSQTKDQEFAQLYLAGIDYCFIGDARQLNLVKTLQKLWQNHWRRIPQDLLNNSDSILSERANRMLQFLEQAPIQKLSSNELAKHLNISESHFRLEFKKYFHQNFREYKQQLLFHYESILLFEKKLKPREVFNILNYKNLSAFSRSFKTRHGSSWQKIVRLSAE